MLSRKRPRTRQQFREDLRAKQNLINAFREAHFVLDGLNFEFDWDLDTYALKNKLDGLDPQTRLKFAAHRATAAADFEETLTGIRRSEEKRHWTLKRGWHFTRTVESVSKCNVILMQHPS